MPLTEPRVSQRFTTQRVTSSQVWIEHPQEAVDPLGLLKEEFAEFTQRLSVSDALSAKHIFDNPNVSDLDERQHRALLHFLLFKAENIAMEMVALKREDETRTFVEFLDGQATRLQHIFQERYGRQKSPEGFLKLVRENEKNIEAAGEFDDEDIALFNSFSKTA